MAENESDGGCASCLAIGALLLALFTAFVAFASDSPWLGIGAVVVAVVLWRVTRNVRPSSGPSTTSVDHRPPSPPSRPLETWARGTSTEVEGEFARPEAIKALVGHHPSFDTEGGAERLDVSAALSLDASNPHDPKAIAVFVAGLHVGYLARGKHERLHDYVAAAHKQDAHFVFPCRVWGASRHGTRDQVVGRVTIDLPDPEDLTPANPLPDEPYRVLPFGSRIQVTKEEDHLDVLAPYVGSGQGRVVAVTLRATTQTRARSTVELVQVELGSERIGQLTSTQSQNLLPIVRHLSERGLTAVARARVKGSSLKADVVLDACKADDDIDEWLHSVG